MNPFPEPSDTGAATPEQLHHPPRLNVRPLPMPGPMPGEGGESAFDIRRVLGALHGIEGLLASFDARKSWIELRTVAKRWKEDPIYRLVRNKIAFHIDSDAIEAGIARAESETEPAVWVVGNSKKNRALVFLFADNPVYCILRGCVRLA